MSTIKRPITGMISDKTVPVRQKPIGIMDLQIVETMLAEIAPRWSVELHGMCTEDASLVVLPEDGEDMLGPTFAINRESYGLRLGQLHWDELTEIGVFPTLNGVVDAMVTILGDWTDFSLPRSVTIH